MTEDNKMYKPIAPSNSRCVFTCKDNASFKINSANLTIINNTIITVKFLTAIRTPGDGQDKTAEDQNQQS